MSAARNAHGCAQRAQMPLSGVTGEAMRDILSGTTHALLYAAALMALMLASAGAELFQLRSIGERLSLIHISEPTRLL